MDPVAIGKQIKQAFPQYANLDDATIGQKYLQKYGGAISGIQSGQINIKDIPEAQRVGVSVGLQGVGYEPKAQLSAAEQKKLDAATNADRILKQLEDNYYGAKGAEGDLAKGRVGGISATLLEKIGMNAPLRNYKDLLVSIRPTLAKAAGDAGNLALQEQIMAGKVIPTAFATPEEAALKFKTVRARFGLPERNLEEVQGPPLNQFQLSMPNTAKMIQTTQNYPQILQKGGQEMQQSGPLAAPSPELLSLISGGKPEDYAGNRITNAAKSAYRMASTSQGAAGEVATPLMIAGLLRRSGMGLINKLNPSKQIAEGVAKREAGATGAQQGGKLLDGDKIYKQVEKELGGEGLNKVPQAARSKVAQLLEQFKADFKGQVDPVKAMERLQGTSAGGTFTAKGGISTKASSGFEAALNRVLKKEFSTVAPEVVQGQAQIATGKTLQDIFNKKGIAKNLVNAGATGLAFALLYKLLSAGGNNNSYYGAGE